MTLFKKTLIFFPFFLLILFCIFSCGESGGGTEIPCPREIAERAFFYAEKYTEHGTEYSWGGQDPLPRIIKIDCSGLVVNCYKYALQDFGEYELIQPDMSSAYMYSDASYLTVSPEKGDLIFMGEKDSGSITHIALFEKCEDGKVHFIDSTQKSEENINGVSRRHYPEKDPRIKSYGIMKLQK